VDEDDIVVVVDDDVDDGEEIAEGKILLSQY
jgi:hypothetical protein